jgi:hypothetical protein
MRRRILAGLVMAGLVAIGGTSASAASELFDDAPSTLWLGRWSIVGTWTLQVTLVNCQTGDPVSNVTFPALNTFLAEGSMLSDPASNPALQRTGHGVWAFAGGRNFTNTVILFRFNPDGSYAGTQTVRRNITVSRSLDEFTARDTATIADPSGTVIDTRCGMGQGRRLQQ